MVVLVDEYSASAAEIVAGALQDHDRALVVGNTTYGKGSVQSLFRLSGGNFLKMTTGKWYTPVGRSIQKPFRRRTPTPRPTPTAWRPTPRRRARTPRSGAVPHRRGAHRAGRRRDRARRDRARHHHHRRAGVHRRCRRRPAVFNDVLGRYAVEYERRTPA
jgi:carboxyl-terminal processing protease